jgi:hypothetical protein
MRLLKISEEETALIPDDDIEKYLLCIVQMFDQRYKTRQEVINLIIENFSITDNVFDLEKSIKVINMVADKLNIE